MNKQMTLMWVRGSPVGRSLSPVLAALLTLQISGCAFHSYSVSEDPCSVGMEARPPHP